MNSFRSVVRWYAVVLAILLSQLVGGMARGPGWFLDDMMLTKRFGISERWGKLEFRAAAFSVFNHTVLDDPIREISQRKGSLDQITTAKALRTAQLAIRYMF